MSLRYASLSLFALDAAIWLYALSLGAPGAHP
jgi:hypothetical protein